MRRRDFLSGGTALLALGWAGARSRLGAAETRIVGEWATFPAQPMPTLPLVNARPDRFVRMTVGLRPFRAAGPNLDVERVGTKTVVHNYGHGGSGWSLSWGTAAVAVERALGTGERDIAIIGAGAAGLTTATLLQRAGARVTIYAKERPPAVTSSFATGVWSPDSRVCLKPFATRFAPTWQQLCRSSFAQYQLQLGLTDEAVRWCDRYALSELPWEEARKQGEAKAKEKGEPEFGKFQELVRDLTPEPEELPAGSHPFATRFVRRSSTMVFNLTAMTKRLVEGFLLEGGRFVIREFSTPAELEGLPEKTIVNATGLGAKDLFHDETMTPVRGQLGVLVPQREINYGLSGEGFSMVPRHDGIVVQTSRKGDFGSTDLAPDRAEAEEALLALARVCAKLPRVAA